MISIAIARASNREEKIFRTKFCKNMCKKMCKNWVPGEGVCGVISWRLAIEGIGGVVGCVRSRVLGWVGG